MAATRLLGGTVRFTLLSFVRGRHDRKDVGRGKLDFVRKKTDVCRSNDHYKALSVV